MKLSKLTLALFVLLFSFANCSDSMLISQKINQLKEEGKIETVVVDFGNANTKNLEIAVADLKIENELLVVGGSYLNLGEAQRMELVGRRLIVIY